MIHVRNEKGIVHTILGIAHLQLDKIKAVQTAHIFDSYLELQATAEDLLYILAEFEGIPKPRTLSTADRFTWHGHIAKTILENLV